ncbi:MAG: aspartate-semialdehyde dehydrogenase [Thaumarchaeota archaeon]|jgi:aspartate-semialdehyde dehydrogenase|nr:aspartate-semialdehyde dehydrogenase [Candidatus Geocrenenecus arthurdayi]
MKTIKIGILGATGMVGVEYIDLLVNHPWFKISTLSGKKSVGKKYGEAVRTLRNVPEEVEDIEVVEPDPKKFDADLVFSSLPSDAAREIEPRFIEYGFPVVSEASAHRMEPHVPLMIPEVNPDHLELINIQKKKTEGFIVTTPNCTAVGLVLSLKPVLDRYGVSKVVVATYQAITGAGFPGVPSYSILGNIIPYIKKEEEKISEETKKILGRFNGSSIEYARFPVEASCARVPTIDGHLEAVYVETEKEVQLDEVIEVFKKFRGEPQKLNLPTAPKEPILVTDIEDRPQPRLDVYAGTIPGMSIVVGRVRRGESKNVLKYFVLSHNRIRGAAGTAILTAELLTVKGYLE